MFGKRGQQLGIAIVAIVIFLGLVGILWQADKAVKDLRTARSAIDPQQFSNHVQRCLDQGVAESSRRIGLHGGYDVLPEQCIAVDGESVPVYLSEPRGIFAVPSAEAVATSIGADVARNIPGCIDLFPVDYDIERGTPEVVIGFTEDTITADLRYSLTLRSGKNAKSLTSWTAIVPNQFPKLRDAAAEYIGTQQGKPFIRLQALVDAVGNSRAEAMLSEADDAVLYQFTAGDSVLQFAVEYAPVDDSFSSVTELLPEQINALALPVRVESGRFAYGDLGSLLRVDALRGNTPPQVPIHQTQRVVVGRTLYFPLGVTDADGDQLRYEILTPLPGLEIRPNGILRWGPTEYQDTTIKFRVSDDDDSTDGQIRIIADYRPIPQFSAGVYS